MRYIPFCIIGWGIVFMALLFLTISCQSTQQAPRSVIGDEDCQVVILNFVTFYQPQTIENDMNSGPGVVVVTAMLRTRQAVLVITQQSQPDEWTLSPSYIEGGVCKIRGYTAYWSRGELTNREEWL